MQSTYRELIAKQLGEATKKISNELPLDLGISIPPQPQFGDYSTNVALSLSKLLGRAPRDIADEVVRKLPASDYLEKTQIEGPGFINFYINQDKLAEAVLHSILNEEKTDQESSDTKIIVEHTSVNPNKAMHVGHIRNAILGDSISKLFKKLGYSVEVHNYIDDTGVQVADTTNAIKNLEFHQPQGQRFDDFAWDIYSEINKQYETNPELQEKRKQISKDIEEGGNATAKLASEIVEKIVDNHLDLMSEFGIFYDLLVYESDIIRFGFWETAFELLKKSNNFVYETEGANAGCWILRYDEKSFGDKIFVRSNGTKVYTAKDTAYHLWKFNLLGQNFKYAEWPHQFDGRPVWKTDQSGAELDTFGKANKIINVIDERQSYPQDAVKFALRSLGYDEAYNNYMHLAYGVVNLSRATAGKLGIDTSDGRDSYPMSGRKGIGVKARDLLNLLVEKIESEKDMKNESPVAGQASSLDIAVAALKHYMLKNNPSSEITFDYEQAVQLTGNTGPYLQYSHARAAGIMRSADGVEYTYQKSEAFTDSEIALVRALSEWPDIKASASKSLNIGLIADYAYRLSAQFHSFYENNIVLKADAGVREFRVTLVAAYKKSIAEVLEIMGIVAPEQM